MKNNNVVLHYRSLFLTVFFLFTYSVIQAQYFQLGSGLSASHASANGSVVVGDNGAEHFAILNFVTGCYAMHDGYLPL